MHVKIAAFPKYIGMSRIKINGQLVLSLFNCANFTISLVIPAKSSAKAWLIKRERVNYEATKLSETSF